MSGFTFDLLCPGCGLEIVEQQDRPSWQSMDAIFTDEMTAEEALAIVEYGIPETGDEAVVLGYSCRSYRHYWDTWAELYAEVLAAARAEEV